MDRPTIEVTLPVCGGRVVLYTFLTTSQLRDIKKAALKAVTLTYNKETEETDVQSIDPATSLETQDLAMRYIVKEAYTKDGGAAPNPVEFVNNLHPDDGDVVYDKINELTAKSVLDAVSKKK